MDDPIRKSQEMRVDVSPEPVRVVLAEAHPPGSLRYLLESEGLLVIGSASDEVELGRVLGPGLDPDVVVLDTDVSVTSAIVARERAPSAHVIVVWPDGVQPLPGTERIAPWLVYEQLGPSIRRAMRDRSQRQASSVTITDAPSPSTEMPMEMAADASPRRPASRVWVAPIVLIGAFLLTMGAAIALEGLHAHLPWAAPSANPTVHQVASSGTPTPAAGTGHARHDPGATAPGACRPSRGGVPKQPNPHAAAGSAAARARPCPIRHGGSDTKPGHHGGNHHPGGTHHPGGKPSGKPDGSHGASSHHDSGAPKGNTSGTNHGHREPSHPSSPPGKTEHGPR